MDVVLIVSTSINTEPMDCDFDMGCILCGRDFFDMNGTNYNKYTWP